MGSSLDRRVSSRVSKPKEQPYRPQPAEDDAGHLPILRANSGGRPSVYLSLSRSASSLLLRYQATAGNAAVASALAAQRITTDNQVVQRRGARRGPRRGRGQGGRYGPFRPPPGTGLPRVRRPRPEEQPGHWRWVRSQRRRREREIAESQEYLKQWAAGERPTAAGAVLKLLAELIGFGDQLKQTQKELTIETSREVPRLAKTHLPWLVQSAQAISQRQADTLASIDRTNRLLARLKRISGMGKAYTWHARDKQTFDLAVASLLETSRHLEAWASLLSQIRDAPSGPAVPPDYPTIGQG